MDGDAQERAVVLDHLPFHPDAAFSVLGDVLPDRSAAAVLPDARLVHAAVSWRRADALAGHWPRSRSARARHSYARVGGACRGRHALGAAHVPKAPDRLAHGN